MAMKVSVKTRIVVNGEEYGSVEELPPEVRAIYEKAMAAVPIPAAGASSAPGAGQRVAGSAPSPDDGPIEPVSSGLKWILVAIPMALLLIWLLVAAGVLRFR